MGDAVCQEGFSLLVAQQPKKPPQVDNTGTKPVVHPEPEHGFSVLLKGTIAKEILIVDFQVSGQLVLNYRWQPPEIRKTLRDFRGLKSGRPQNHGLVEQI